MAVRHVFRRLAHLVSRCLGSSRAREPVRGPLERDLGTGDDTAETFESLVTALVPKAPPELRHTFESVTSQLDPQPTTAVALLDAIDQARAGLGVAIGRGDSGEDERYKQLCQLVSWLYQELRCPPTSRYAVVERAIARLRAEEAQGDQLAADQ